MGLKSHPHQTSNLDIAFCQHHPWKSQVMPRMIPHSDTGLTRLYRTHWPIKRVYVCICHFIENYSVLFLYKFQEKPPNQLGKHAGKVLWWYDQSSKRNRLSYKWWVTKTPSLHRTMSLPTQQHIRLWAHPHNNTSDYELTHTTTHPTMSLPTQQHIRLWAHPVSQ